MSGEPAPSPAESYLGGSVGVHLDHVLSALFDLELNVILSFQGGEAAITRAHSGLTVGGIWSQRAFWVKMEKNNRKKLAPLRQQSQICDYVLLDSLTNIHSL